MARKKGFDYFDAMYQLSMKTKEASLVLDDIITHYSSDYLLEKAESIHQLEREGDEIVSSIMYELNHSFITPIDREDIIAITKFIDKVLDNINALPYSFDNLGIQKMRKKAIEMSALIVEIVEALTVVTKEFSKFKSTKSIGQMIQKVTELEGKADIIHSAQIKELFTSEENVLEVVRWKEVFDRLEKIVNGTEQVVLIMEAMVIKNT
ncbi:DUF47 family protein [Vagococcus carniphilus]|uniref:DUF47 domain-containing protein n=1 Tax=Vagococcus carniphilus TaxID=218144 RepID=UPI00288F1968|nr:DUF47 family protein [Vagococcus carniphilus]MDT2830707.1 DUF47 family protein [Vagococcus carniphilus]MDT2839521.1 DUF47 family protein [Vagococcus carniphilus]MDT2853870.1 DUF47 family protein [Vagococcus carniphilus]